MTTLAELGVMLISVEDHGRVLQSEKISTGDGYEQHTQRLFDLENFRFRLKPLKKTVYVNLDHGAVFHKSADVAIAVANTMGASEFVAIAVPVEIEE